jgi:hypothetical protein
VTALRRITLALAIAASACATPAATASPTVSAAATATGSPQPTPVATKAAPWTELRWSAPVPIPDQGSIFQVLSWHDGYVAAGQTTDNGQYVGGLFASPDGVQWQRTAILPLGPALVATATRLVAVVTTGRDNAAPSVHARASSDGRTWQPQDALAIVGATFDHLTARGSTIVGMGTDSSGRAVMWRSIDGAAWTPGDLPSAHAIVRDVFAVSDGFIALGREGEPDVASGGVGVRGVGLPAAWWSADGRAWTALQVEGKPAAGAQLIQLFAVADGYFAVGSDTTDPSINARSPLIWTSSDARAWRLLGPPPYWGAAGSNGERAVYFVPSATGTRDLQAQVSRDGRQWTPLSFTGDLADIPNLPGFTHGSQLDQVFVVAHGIIVIGQQNGRPVAWFADAEPH